MKVLITGGAGFIGSAVVRLLINETDVAVINVDKLTYAGNLDSLHSIAGSAQYRFEHADICDRSRLAAIFERYDPDAVLHLAAESHVDRSIDGPDDFVRTNVFGTASLLQVALGRWRRMSAARQKKFRFLHVSTDEVYGDLGETTDPFRENSPYAPSSPYSATKAASDHLVRAWHRTYELPIVIAHCSNNYGPYQFPEKFIPHVILNAVARNDLPIYGDGEQVRDWLYVEDHARALWGLVTHGRVGDTYNIGGRNQQRNIDVARMICACLGRQLPNAGTAAEFESLIKFVADRPGHDRRYAIDAGKIERELGWEPQETFETGLVKTVRWYLANEPWWRRVLTGSYRLERIGFTEAAR